MGKINKKNNMTELTLEQKERFFRNQKKVGEVIINHVKKKGLILFGQKATNKQLPKDLRKDTQDYDIFSQTPQKTAKRIERKLDRKLRGNFFIVKKAIHGGTYKVKSRIGDKGVVDVGKPDRKVPTITKKGVRLATLEFQKQQIRKSLADKASAFRHAKDREVRSRIKIAEQRGKRKINKSKVPRSLRFDMPSFQINTRVNI